MTFLEICVDSVESAMAAEEGGAQRVELCSALSEGGLTPSLGLIRAVRSRLKIGVHVMIRPRGGDFLYCDDELAVMREDIALAGECGVAGVVFGVLTAECDVDVDRTRVLVERARPMEVTFHRAIDVARDMNSAFEDVIRTGADRVLTSGGEASAMLGLGRIRWMVDTAQERIQVMAGGGVRPENASQIAQGSGVKEFHSSLRSAVSSAEKRDAESVYSGRSNIGDYPRSVVRLEDVRALRDAIRYVDHGRLSRTIDSSRSHARRT